MTSRIVTSVAEIERDAWDALEHGDSPFTLWGFLRALELSDSVGSASGWDPRYVVVERDGELHGAVPAYIKTHSYGEYIFDWSWARACERAGIPYYPKLVVAVPHTPASGHRLLVRPDSDGASVRQELVDAVAELAITEQCLSVHWLFCSQAEAAFLVSEGYAERASYQFHFVNDDYESFDSYLGAMRSRRRKQIRKERERARAEIDGIEFAKADTLALADYDHLDQLYRHNTYCHGGIDYLQPGFFHHLGALMPEQMLVATARANDKAIARALFLETDTALFGRYWGCERGVEFLHFETAYYSGVERAIATGKRRFEAGAQGRHKLLRGFLPKRTYSCHMMRIESLDQAIRGFIREEYGQVRKTMDELATLGPFRRDADDAS